MAQGRAQLRRFKATDDRGGEVIILEIKPTNFRRAANGRLIDNSPQYTIFELMDGEPVNRREDGTYEAVNTGQILREIG
jgi:hypothetical protein